jgi:hypothetical protein
MAFSDQMRDMVNKGMAASREIVSKAASQAQTWGEMGVLKVEVVQLRSQAKNLTAQLGAEVYAALVERSEESVSLQTPVIKDITRRIAEVSRQADEKQAAFRRLGGKDSDLDD